MVVFWATEKYNTTHVIFGTIFLCGWISRTEAWWSYIVDTFKEIQATPVPDMPLNYDVQDGEEFEYVVVGAGAAGAAAASRLALAGHRTLLLEAGGDPTIFTTVPSAAQGLLGSTIDWAYPTISNQKSCLSSEGQQCRFSRGMCLGGSTSINYMIYVRGNRNDYNYNMPGWSWKELEQYFLRYEALQSDLPASSNPYHNKSGIMSVSFFEDSENEWHAKLIEAYKHLSFPKNPDANAESQIGVSQVIGYNYQGHRMSTARAYLSNDEVKSRLKVSKHSLATGLVWEESVHDPPTVKGVTFIKHWKTLKVKATKAVVVSAGALGTPAILQRAGIGPASVLNALNIPVRVDLPVGENMDDHILPLLFVRVDKSIFNLTKDIFEAGIDAAKYLVNHKGPFASNGLTDVTTLLNTKCYDFKKRKLLQNRADCEDPTMQIIHAHIDRGLMSLVKSAVKKSTNFVDNVIEQIEKANLDGSLIVFSLVVLRPESRGWVRVTSHNPSDPPSIFPNYLGENADVEEMLRSIKIVEHLIETPVFKEANAEIVKLDLECGEMEYWECYVRHMTFSVFHAAGTARVGEVTDEEQRVAGVRGLRVADLSLLRQVPRGNTAAAAIALGERVAHLLLRDSTSHEHYDTQEAVPHKLSNKHSRKTTKHRCPLS